MKIFGAVFLGFVLTASASFAGGGGAPQAPQCLDDNGDAIAVNDTQVVQWEQSTPNQFLARAHVSGPIVQLYPNQTGHAHFAIQIGQDPSQRLEVVYNLDFGAASAQVGDQVEACGDYITSTAQAGHYPPSPDGAIIHWVHQSDNTAKHPDGFLIIDGVLYGQGGGDGSW